MPAKKYVCDCKHSATPADLHKVKSWNDERAYNLCSECFAESSLIEHEGTLKFTDRESQNFILN